MTMRVIRAGSEEEMVAVFLRGELLSARFGDTVRDALAQAGGEEDIVLSPDLEDEGENAVRREVLATARGFGREGLFGEFPDDVSWERAALAPAEVLAIRYIDYDYWVELSGGTRSPADAARRIREGVEVFGVPSAGFHDAVDELAAAVAIPELIVVSPGDEAPLVVLEGHVRLTAYALRPELLPHELEVLLGTSPSLTRWALY
jgi:hypothetical protein